MSPKIQGTVTLTYIRSGMSKSDKPYAMFSNGRKEFFVSLAEESDLEMFANLSEDDTVEMEVEVTVGSDRMKVLSVQ